MRLGNPTTVGNCYYPWAKGEKREMVWLASVRVGALEEATALQGPRRKEHGRNTPASFPSEPLFSSRCFPFAGSIWELAGKGGVSISRPRVKERQAGNES